MNKLLIANRGEIALRIMRSCRRLGVATVAVYSEADQLAPHVEQADEAVCIGPAAVDRSYLNGDAILAAARSTGADGIHPGYGFLSENAEFAEAVIADGLTWVGPTPESIRRMGSKISARELAQHHDVPVIPAMTVTAADTIDSAAIADTIGLPLLIKASAGGGGIGMREVHAPGELEAALSETREQATRQFGSGDLLVERLLSDGRHIEVQVLGDRHGKLLHLYERDCSTQRRRQKLLEESPAPDLPENTRKALHAAALRLAGAVDYQGAGTVEFLVDRENFYLLEMNTRLQVEHGVTEAVCGIDLVELQLDIARGVPLPLDQDDIACRGHAIEARVYAEDPARQFLPETGKVLCRRDPALAGLRVDSGVETGTEVGHHYDGLLCKLIVHARDRDTASRQLASALRQLALPGIKTNQRFLSAVLAADQWRSGMRISTLEAELDHLLEAARLPPEQHDIIIAAASISQFRREPDAADTVFWPGAAHRDRQSTWQLDNTVYTANWRWTASDRYDFEQPGLHVELVQSNNAGDMTLQINGARHRFAVFHDSAHCWVWHRDTGSVCLQAKPVGASNRTASDNADCVSHGPGQVLRVLVQAGDPVDEGQPMVVIESMKMESTLFAGRSGAVADIAVSEGELISSGQLLVRLAAEGESAK